MAVALSMPTGSNAVSPTYARRSAHRTYGEGLEWLLTSERQVAGHILNGIDTKDWDPASDAPCRPVFRASNPRPPGGHKADPAGAVA